MPLVEAGQESGVGRWHTIRLTTLSFSEYLQIKNLWLPALPRVKSLRDLFDWPQSDLYPSRYTQRQSHNAPMPHRKNG
jgi:predicted AAA+ superfamily ATPase